LTAGHKPRGHGRVVNKLEEKEVVRLGPGDGIRKGAVFSLARGTVLGHEVPVLVVVAVHVVVPFGTRANVDGKPVQIVEDFSFRQINQGKTACSAIAHSHDVDSPAIPTIAPWPFVGGAGFHKHRAIVGFFEGDGP
jgi:hypothetical protein